MSTSSERSPVDLLLREGPVAINLGLAGFAQTLRVQGVPVVHVEWTPPAVDKETASLLGKLL